MKWNSKILISISFIIILIISSYNINAKLPKSISEDIWADGFFEGKITIRNLDGNISGMINLGRTSKNGVFQAKIFFNNKSYDAKGWFKEKIIYGTFKNDLISIPMIGFIDLKKSSFEVSLIIPNGFIMGNYTASYLPPVRGLYGIGVKEYHIIDKSREEVLTENPDDIRELMIKIWYPTDFDIDGESYNYMTEVMFSWLMGRAPIPLPGVSDTAYMDVMPHGKINVPITNDKDNFPLVLFAHGLDGTLEIYTSFIEELVTRGYIVISMNHPYIAGVVEFPDGRTIYYQNFYNQNDTDYANKALRTIIEDAKFTLDFAEILNKTDDIFKDRIDIQNVGMYGHSFGGASTSVCCVEDDRIDCGLTLDGVSYEELIPDGVTKPFFMMTADGRFNSSGVEYIWNNQESNIYRMSIHGSSHYGYTDVGLLLSHMLPLIPQKILGFGTIDAKLMVEIVRLFIVEFFNVYLKNENETSIIDLAEDFSPYINFESK
jgi:hypothetical protein